MVAVAAASVFSACGDVDAFKLRSDSWGETQPLVDWNGTVVELHHQTLPCDIVASECLSSFVGEHMEFNGFDVKGLKSECSRGAEAAVAVDVQGRSIIFDFSNVDSPDVFRGADFNGYVVHEMLAAAPEILAAELDREVSTLDLEDEDIVIDGSTIRANFAGHSFDETDFVKIDLVFAEVE
jgi:hypothetical protein